MANDITPILSTFPDKVDVNVPRFSLCTILSHDRKYLQRYFDFAKHSVSVAINKYKEWCWS